MSLQWIFTLEHSSGLHKDQIKMKYLIILAMALPLLTACIHHHPTHRDGPGNSENAPGHNKHKHDHDNGKHKDKHD